MPSAALPLPVSLVRSHWSSGPGRLSDRTTGVHLVTPPPGPKSGDRRSPGVAGSLRRPSMERGPQQAITNVTKRVPTGPGATCTGDKRRSGAARPDQETLRLRAQLARGRVPGRQLPRPGRAPGALRGRLSRMAPTGKPAPPSPPPPQEDPAPAARLLGLATKRPGASVRAPGQGHRRRGDDSPRAGGSPRRRPRAARR